MNASYILTNVNIADSNLSLPISSEWNEELP
jgi:hypothetical protein